MNYPRIFKIFKIVRELSNKWKYSGKKIRKPLLKLVKQPPLYSHLNPRMIVDLIHNTDSFLDNYNNFINEINFQLFKVMLIVDLQSWDIFRSFSLLFSYSTLQQTKIIHIIFKWISIRKICSLLRKLSVVTLCCYSIRFEIGDFGSWSTQKSEGKIRRKEKVHFSQFSHSRIVVV